MHRIRISCLSLMIVGTLVAQALAGDSVQFSLSSDRAAVSLNAADLYRSGTPDAGTAAFRTLSPPKVSTPSFAVGSAVRLAPLSLGASGSGPSTYLGVKAGPLWFLDDLEDLSTGFYSEVVFGFKPLGSLLAIELESGYFSGDDSAFGASAELWGVPFLVNARVALPLLIFEVYGGGGIGGYYIHSEVRTFTSSTESDFVFGGDVFVGLGLNLGPVYVAAEGKYIIAEDANVPGGGTVQLQGLTAMVSAGLSF